MGFLPKSVGSQSREFPGIFENPRDFGNSQKNPKNEKKIPGIWDFSGEKNPKSPGFGIWELGSQKNPIPKPALPTPVMLTLVM